MTISAAVAAAAANDVIEVEDGTYNENVTISQALTLQSANGRSVTTIVGSDSGPAGTILINSGTSGVTIDGFTIVGFDNVLNGAIEYAAVYLRGAVTNTTIKNNEIVANGEAGLLSEYNAAIDNILIDNNIFSGITYNLSLDGGLPGECGFATQFDNPNTNVPRQLVVMGGGGGVTNSMNVTFTNNQVIGKAGDASAVPCNSPLDEQGNTLVTIDVINATITGNSFTGMTTRFASMLRTRGINTTISNNDFDGTNIGPVVAYVCIDANALDGATPSDLDGVQADNTFDPESFVNLPALCIYKCTPPAGFNQVVFNQDNCYGETDAGLRGLEVGPAPGADEVGFWRILEFIPGPGSDLSSFAPAPGGTGTGGPFSNADNASTSAEFEISADGSTFTPVASPTGASGNPLYGTYVLEVVVRNTVSGCESDAFGPLEKVMAACDGSFVTAAPCGCLDNATTLSNGQFSQLFTVEALPGQTINATAASGLYTTGSPAPPAAPTSLTVPTAFTETATPGTVAGTVVYELQAIHVDGDGYTLEVSDGTSTASVSNTCYYPNPQILGLAGQYDDTDPAVPLSGQADRGDGGGLVGADSESFDILDSEGNILVADATEFDPSALCAGTYTVKYTFDAEELTSSIVHEQGFEDPGFAMGGDDWNANGSNVTREVSGANSGASGASITSADGAAHAAVAPASAGAAFTRLGGYSSSFGNGFRTSLDVYLDLADPAVAADTYGWDLSSAVSDPAGAHRRDFIFHTASNASGEILVAGSNNTNFTRRNDLASINHYTVTTSGWYTFEWIFRDAGGGVLAVDLNLKDAAGTILWTETRSDPSDIIGSTVGGNRYIWFTFTETSYLPIDNTLLEYDADGFPGCTQMVTQEVTVASTIEAFSVMLMACPSTPGGNSADFTLTDAEDPDAPSNGGSIFDINIDVDGDGSPGTTPPISVSYHPSAPDAANDQNEITDVPFNSTSTVIYARVENTTTGCAQVRPIRLVVNDSPEAPEAEGAEMCQGDGANPPLTASCTAPPNITDILLGFYQEVPGPDELSALLVLDPGTGLAFPFGSIGYERCTNMEFDPATGLIYAACERNDGSDQRVLLTFDILGPALVELGPISGPDLQDPSGMDIPVFDLAFTASGDLYLTSFSNNACVALFAVDKQTGAVSLVGDPNVGTATCAPGNAFDIDAAGQGWHTNVDDSPLGGDGTLYSLDTGTGVSTPAAPLSYVGFPPSAFGGYILTSMDIDPATGAAYVTVADGGGAFGISYLGVLDLATGVVAFVGPPVSAFILPGLNGIAFASFTDNPSCQVKWYDENGMQVGTGDTFDPVAANEVDPNMPGVYSFFAECTCDNGCPSARTEATFTVYAPEPPTVENAWICADETLTALPPGEGLMAECMVDPISVLVVGNVVLPVPGFMADIQSKLISDPRFSTVDVHDITLLGVPTLAQLQNYDAVLAFVDGANPPAAYGTVLKDYADAGGAIVNMASSNIINNVANYALSGTWPGSPYPLITTGGSASGTATLGTVYDAAHPTMQGVASFNGGTFSGRNNTNTLIGGATRIADWSDGNPLVVVGEGLGPNSVRRAALNFYPPSSDVFAGLLWNSSTDGALLMANALYWVANPAVCEVIWYDGSDNVVGMGEVFDPVAANELDPGVPGDYSFFAECSCNGCASARTEAIFTVRPIPVVQPVADIMACPGAAVGDILLTSLPADVNTTFDWTVSDASDVINLADGAMGSAGGPNPAISGITANNASGTATISVTATLNGCQGDPIIITIMVGDGEMPVISGCPGNINLNTDAGLCTAVATWIPPTANDNCDGPLMPSGNYAPGAVFPVGMTMVTYNVSDAAGNAATPCSFTVTVRDKEDPEARCRDIDIVLGPDGTASISPGDIDNGSSDACGIESLSLSQEDFTCGDVGANSIRLTVTDENGNEDKCTATVTVESLVEDNTDPVARCEDATVHLDNDGEGDIDVSDIDDGSYDNCRIASLSLSKRNFDCDDIGENTVTLTVIDISGNDSECTATVTVEDNRDPDADCRDITVQLGAGGSASISPLDVDGGSSDNCGIEARRLSQERFTCSDLGANNIRLTIIDESGNDGWCTATVTVEAPPVAPILYVDASASSGRDGSSWNQAYDDLQDALGLACGCASGNTQIWVADGTYTPSQRVDFNNNGEDEAREAVFQLCDGVAVFGGFEGQPGTEGDFSVRNPAAFVSILSGDRNGNDQDTDNDGLADDNLGDNAYHVVSGSNTGPGAILDGFTVTGGRASGSGINEVGGGMLNFNGSPSVANCVFAANTAESSGGGMANFGGSPNLYDCIFSNNTANQGGGMYNSSADPYLGNCLFAGNVAESTGGGMANRNSEPELANNTFSGNAAGYRGGALYNSGSSPELLNCILWNNLADGDTQSSNASIYNQTGSAPRIAFSLVANSGGSGGWDAALGVDDGDNIDTDPLFFLPLNPANAPATFGDVHLQPASPAIDAGANNGATPAGLDGNPRPMDGDNDNVPDADMGVYEYPGTCPAPIAQCQDIFVQIGVNGLATVDASQLDGGSSGCAPFSFTAGGQATLSFGCGDIGPNGLILEVTDAFNASDACAVTVTVEDGLGVCPCTLPGDDQDMDGICDGVDNCPSTYNPLQYDTDQDGTGDACSQSVCLDIGIAILINYTEGLNLDARAERAITARLGWAALRFCAGSSDASVIAVLDNLTAYLQSESGDDIPAGEAVYLLDQVDRLSILIQAGMAECCSPVPPAPLAGEGAGALPSDNWLELEPMEGPSMDVFPNPFSSQATVRFFLPQEGRASLEVFNLQGQRLGILAAGAFDAGSQEVSWDGSADGGKALESGVYLLRLITEDGILAKRVSFVR
ncbi:MAG: HYR domain-containing protein [Lewinellaceae bacterium]|nr:HYR domain-containing protein [Phaeodactylibacter sp.]MCB9039912.1 HYR domain-containing protein [Lewinellaceae bacterium]